MISIIICSISPEKFAAVSRNYKQLMGDEPFEIVGIHDVRSLAQGYNRGIAQSKGDLLVFSHDDVEILTPHFVARFKEHFKENDMIGVAGTSRLVFGEWSVAGHPHIFGQFVHPNPQEKAFDVGIFGVPSRVVNNIQALDGLFFAARRAVVEKIRFDEQRFDGFHCYDLDFTFAAYLAGFRIAVANDLPLLHISAGSYDEVWNRYAVRFMEKYGQRLPQLQARKFGFAWVRVPTKAEALELMESMWAAVTPGA